MTTRGGAVVLLLTAMGCQAIAGLGDFAPDDGGDAPSGAGGGGGGSSATGGGAGPGPTTTTTTTTTTGSTASSGAVTSSSTGGGGCTTDHLVISEVRTRGPEGGGNGDFIEILNPTPTAVVLDDTFRIAVRGEAAGAYGDRWRGDGSLTIGPGERVLLVNEASGPPGGVPPDDTYATGITDGASVVLYRGDTVVDAVCFLCTTSTLARDFVCEGTPLERIDTCGSSEEHSVQRRAAGGVDGCADTTDNALDLEDRAPSTPTGLSD